MAETKPDQIEAKPAKEYYSFPEYGFSVEATSPEEAIKLAQKQLAENK